MRNNEELLDVFLNNKKLFETGICYWLYKLNSKSLITIDEYDYLIGIVNRKSPFLYKIGVIKYIFKKGKIKPRIKFLKKHLL